MNRLTHILFKNSILLIIILLTSAINVYAAGESIRAEYVDFNIEINGEARKIENDMILIDGRTYLPLREIAECLDLYVSWDEEEKLIKISEIGILNYSEEKANIKRNTGIVNVSEADFKIKINGYERELEEPVVVHEGVSYLPVREIAQMLNLKVDWFDDAKTVSIEKQTDMMIDDEFLLPFNICDDDSNYLWGYMDKNGNVVTEPQYADAGDFSEGMAYVLKDDDEAYGYGFIDVQGNEIIPCIYDDVFDFSEGLAAAGIFNDDTNMIEYKFIDKSGNTAIDKVFYRESFDDMEFHNGYAPVTVLNEHGQTENIYINKYGEEKADFGECKISNFQNGYAVVEDSDNNNIKIINTEFETVIDFKDSGYDTSYGSYIMGEGFLTLRNNMKKWGAVDYKNKLIIPFDYDYMGGFSERVFAVGKYISGRMEYGFIDLNGTPIISGLNNAVDSFRNSVCFVLNDYENDSMTVNIINKTGEYIKENIDAGFWAEPDKNIYPEGIRSFFKDGRKIYVNASGEYIDPSLFHIEKADR